jgi:hypothetical protein
VCLGKTKNKSTLCAIVHGDFASNPFEPDTLFIKCVHALNLTGQLKLFYIYLVNMVNSKKEYPDKMGGNHFEHLQDGSKGKV